jgi:Uma2 family endonuclease
MTTPLRFTIADLEALPDRLDDTRYEVIDGDLHVSTQPHWRHQLTAGQAWFALRSWSDQTGNGMAIEAPGVIFTPEDAVAPDVVWVSQERLPYVVGDDGKLHSAPDLMVEVLSPGRANEERDRDAKLKLYSRQGVREYWIVDWRTQTVQVYRRHEAALRLEATLTAEDTITSPLLPGFACTVAALCASPL